MRPTTPDPPDFGVALAAAIRSSRLRASWTERELARRLNVSHGAIHRLETGDLAFANLRLVSAAFKLLGIRWSLDANGPGLADRVDQRDRVHAQCVEYVVRRLRSLGWTVRTEVEIGGGRSRGWIDILAFRPADGAIMCIEVKTVIVDAGRILRSLGWYSRSSWQAARAEGWRPRSVRPALILLATAESDARLQAQHSVFRASLPGDARELGAWAAEPAAPVPRGSISMIDPRSRRRSWLWRTWADGRRSRAPYADYADAARRLDPETISRAPRRSARPPDPRPSGGSRPR
jgi:transcriptional regulator with XRE-family HTH domain